MRLALPAVLCVAIGCAHTTTSTVPTPPPAKTAASHAAEVAPPADAWYGDLRALAAEAAGVRGMKLAQPFTITPLDDAAFADRYSLSVAKRARELAPALTTVLTTFHLAERSGPSTIATQAKEVRNEQYLAFYEFETHTMFVRATLSPALIALGEDFRLALLAHEVGHVLQDQRGVAKLFTSTNEFDRLIAIRALLEGDATLTATLVLAKRKGWSPARGVERSRLTAHSLTPEQLLEATGVSGKLSAAPPLIRELMVFPYFRGAQLLNDLFRAGGLELVDAALDKPPRASWAIESPQRWLDGDPGPLGLGPPEKGGELGGMLLRVLLEGCHADPALALLYRGDRFTVAADVPLTWATRWETEAAAATAATAFAKLNACWHLPDGEIAIKRSGKLVVLADATVPAVRAAAVESALHAKLPPDGAPPFGRRLVPPVDTKLALRQAGPGTWTADTWRHDLLGATWTAQGPHTVVPNASSLFTVRGTGFLIVASYIDDASNERTRDQFVDAFMVAFSNGAFHEVPAGLTLATKHAWTPVAARAVAGSETHELFSLASGKLNLDVRCRLYPLCSGNAGLYLVAVAFTPDAANATSAWLDALTTTRADPPICTTPDSESR